MIRINLLAVERERTKRRTGLQAGQKVTIVASLLLVATVLGIGWWYWSLRQSAIAIEKEIADAQRETIRLRGLLTQVQQFEARKAQLQQRVALIEELRKGQGGPVHMLDKISRSVPDRLWLTELLEKDNEITIDGRTTTLTALSDFVANLESSGYFQRPVEIVKTQIENVQQTDLVRFTVKARFQQPGVVRASGAPAEAGARPAVR